MNKSTIILALLCSVSLLAGCLNSSHPTKAADENTYSVEITTSVSETESSNTTPENTEQSSESIQQIISFRLKEPYSYTDDEMTTILFEDEDLKNKLDLAIQLKYGYIDRTYPPDFSFSDECIVEYAGINDRPYCRTNIDYNSFIEIFKICFTDKCMEELFKDKNDRYINDNGTLMLEDINGLQNSPCTKELTFDISEQTEEQLTLHGRAKIYHPDDPDEVAYYDYYFLALMTEQGWKFDTFDNSWLYSSATYDYRLEIQE